MTLSDEKIIELWKNIDFSGSYRGIHMFRVLLHTDLGIDISEARLYSALSKEPTFLMHQRKYRPIERRKYITHCYGGLTQADCAYMVPDGSTGQKLFLLLVDVYR